MNKKPKPQSSAVAAGLVAESMETVTTDTPIAMRQSRMVAQQVSYEGPIPHPVHLKQFGEVLVDAPERLLRQYEMNSELNRQAAIRALEADIKHQARAHWLAFTLVVLGLIAALTAGIFGLTYLSCVIAGVLLVGVLGNYLKPSLRQPPQEAPSPSSTAKAKKKPTPK